MRSATVASAAAGALALHAAVNARLLRVPPPHPGPATERVSVLLPVRDEAGRVTTCLRALLVALDTYTDAGGRPLAELVVYDDGSTDGTARLVRETVGGHPNTRLVTGPPPPSGWLGKPHACARLAAAADSASTVFVFVDADVVLAPDAVARTVALLRTEGLALVSPYPRQRAVTPAERLVQPLLQWSWLTFLPLRVAERSSRPSLAAANGQLLAVDADAYRAAGGHTAVRDRVVEDVALLRAFKRAGLAGTVADGADLAECRMYDGWADLRDGYTKSLWEAFGSPAGTATVAALMAWLYLLPPVAALRGSRPALAGVAAGVAGRVVAARRAGGRAWPDAFAHPASVALFAWLAGRSLAQHRAGRLAWKGRPIPARGPR